MNEVKYMIKTEDGWLWIVPSCKNTLQYRMQNESFDKCIRGYEYVLNRNSDNEDPFKQNGAFYKKDKTEGTMLDISLVLMVTNNAEFFGLDKYDHYYIVEIINNEERELKIITK